MNEPVDVDVAFDAQARTNVPWRLVLRGEVIILAGARVNGSSRVGRTVYLHFSARGGGGRYELKVNLDTRRWTLIDAR